MPSEEPKTPNERSKPASEPHPSIDVPEPSPVERPIERSPGERPAPVPEELPGQLPGNPRSTS